MARRISAAAPPAPETLPPPAGDNLSEDTFLHYVNVLAKADAKLKEAQTARKVVRKQAKSAGIELGHLDAVVRMAEWGRDEVRGFFSTRARYALWYRLPLDFQADMFEAAPLTDKPDEQTAEHWGAKGFQAGVQGHDCKPPSECHPEFHQDWIHQWGKGQEKLATGLKTTGTA